MKFDVGFSDTVTPEPQSINYPSFLSDEDIVIYGYTNETVIAEKLEAMTSLYLGNSRLKDVYDLYKFAQADDIDKHVLQDAIKATFKERNTELTDIHKLFEPAFLEDSTMVRQWKSYWKKTEKTEVPEFSQVLKSIENLVIFSK